MKIEHLDFDGVTPLGEWENEDGLAGSTYIVTGKEAALFAADSAAQTLAYVWDHPEDETTTFWLEVLSIESDDPLTSVVDQMRNGQVPTPGRVEGMEDMAPLYRTESPVDAARHAAVIRCFVGMALRSRNE